VEKNRGRVQRMQNGEPVLSHAIDATTTNGNIPATPQFLSPSAQSNPFRRAISLEDQIRDFQRQYDKLYAEVQTLQKVLNVKQTSLERITVHLENEKDISERTLREIAQLDEHLSELYNRNNELVLEKKEVGIDRILPEDRLDREIQLENEIELADQDITSLQKRIKDIKLDIKKHDKTIESMSAKVQNLKRFDKDYELECDNSRLAIKINELNDEVVLLQQFTRKKTEQIELLNTQIENFKYLEREQKELLSSIEFKEAQQEAVKMELDIAQREANRKEKTIQELGAQSKDQRQFKHLEQDKRSLYMAIKKERKKQDELEKTVKWQGGEIEKLHIRLGNMNYALQNCSLINWDEIIKESQRTTDSGVEITVEKKNDGMTVSHGEFKKIGAKADIMRKKIQEMEKVVGQRDSEIETLEYRTSILEKANATTARQHNRTLQQLRTQLHDANLELAAVQLNHEEKLERLESQADRLKAQSQLVFGSPLRAGQ